MPASQKGGMRRRCGGLAAVVAASAGRTPVRFDGLDQDEQPGDERQDAHEMSRRPAAATAGRCTRYDDVTIEPAMKVGKPRRQVERRGRQQHDRGHSDADRAACVRRATAE